MTEIRMPSLGADMEAGTLVEWRIKPGDHVERGQIVAVIETQKATMEMESFVAGEVVELVIAPGEKVPVGTVLARLRPVEAPAATPVAPVPTPPVPAAPVPAAPVPAVAPSAAADRRAEVRRAIAAAMSRSWREIPHYTVGHTVDLAPALAFLEQRNRDREPAHRLVPGVLFARAVALACRQVPEVNGHFVGDAFQPADHVHLGMAIALRGGGVVAPALADADRHGLDELMDSLRDLVERTRAGTLRSSELTDATITLTSLGELGCERVRGIINPPQVAMVGFGAVADRPWVVAGAVAVRPLVQITLAADHRASDGLCGARFLAAIAELLATPERL
jgi:pyruvate dehydrogenase E2 component (dihydrolipoamide acetyltransferase)